MARQEESTPRRAPETTAVSNADSSSATPRFAVDSEGATLPGIDSAGATRPGAPTDPAGGKPSSRNKVSSYDARAVGEGSGSRPPVSPALSSVPSALLSSEKETSLGSGMRLPSCWEWAGWGPFIRLTISKSGERSDLR